MQPTLLKNNFVLLYFKLIQVLRWEIQFQRTTFAENSQYGFGHYLALAFFQ